MKVTLICHDVTYTTRDGKPFRQVKLQPLDMGSVSPETVFVEIETFLDEFRPGAEYDVAITQRRPHEPPE